MNFYSQFTPYRKLTKAELAAEFDRQAREEGRFVRVKASYIHKDRKTGEPEKITIDYVAVCGVSRVPMDLKGKILASAVYEFPYEFMKATAVGGLVILTTPHSCTRSHRYINFDLVRKDLMPRVRWVDDIYQAKKAFEYRALGMKK